MPQVNSTPGVCTLLVARQTVNLLVCVSDLLKPDVIEGFVRAMAPACRPGERDRRRGSARLAGSLPHPPPVGMAPGLSGRLEPV